LIPEYLGDLREFFALYLGIAPSPFSMYCFVSLGRPTAEKGRPTYVDHYAEPGHLRFFLRYY